MAMKIEQKEFKLQPEKERLEIEPGTEKGKREGSIRRAKTKDIVSPP